MSEHEVIVPGREAVALNLVREMMARKLEDPKTSAELLHLFCRCLLAVRDPDRTLLQAAAAAPTEHANAERVEAIANAPGSF